MGRKRRGHKKRRPAQSVTHANVRPQALWGRWIPTDLRSVLLPAALIELFLLGLFAAIPVGGVTLSLSPLARAWPWLLAPARLLAGDALVDGSVPPEQNPAALALVATLLVGASCAAGLAVLRARPNASGGRRLLVILLGITLLFGVTMLLLPCAPFRRYVQLYPVWAYLRRPSRQSACGCPVRFSRRSVSHARLLARCALVYGTVWLMLSSGISLLAEAFGGGLLSYTLLFKLLGLIAHLANAWLIWLHPGRALAAVAPTRHAALCLEPALPARILRQWAQRCGHAVAAAARCVLSGAPMGGGGAGRVRPLHLYKVCAAGIAALLPGVGRH